MAKKTVAKKPMSKTEIYTTLAERTGFSKKDIGTVFDELTQLIEENLSKKGPRVFNMPGMMKIYVHHKKATKARMGRNPQTGEEVKISAKPATDVIKVRPLKGLKEML
ncbi:HU family DNA-binding protein [Stratiformator vulcanicus]|uniref:Viral histone-like protein n=1 Tax=Stratiformator vulcanicus TaxID=2527980 RepID=A0A517R6H6_9PLAN|nr:HU family DNA-binding protein [Stratiformator vulcanicus]QDT39442.1 DNA-binding protein HRL53 [Stratiformator vulcanicus]